MKETRLASILIGFFAICGMSFAAPPLQNALTWEVLGTPSLFNPAEMQISGNYAFFATRYGLQVVDVSEAGNPRLVANAHMSMPPYGIAIQGSIAYLACWSDGLVVMDIANPLAPVQVGKLDLPGYFSKLRVAGNYVYASGYGTDFFVIDVSDPSSPIEVGRYSSSSDITNVTDMEVTGSNVLLTDDNGGLIVMGVGNPSAPSKVGGYNSGRSAKALEIIGNYAYLGDDGLNIIDISNPAQLWPKTIIVGPIDFMARNGNLLYAGRQIDSLLRVFDVSSPDSPHELVSVPNLGYVASGLKIRDTIGYCLRSGLRLVSLAEAAHPRLLQVFSRYPENYGDALIDGRYAYVITQQDGLLIYDLNNTGAPELVGSFIAEARAIAKADNYVYLLHRHGLAILDVSDPALLHVVGSYPVEAEHDKGTVSVKGTRAYISVINSIQALDVSNPSLPVRLGEYDANRSPYEPLGGGTVRNDTMFIANEFGGILIVSFSDPSSPVLVGNYPSDMIFHPIDIDIAGNLAFAACSNYGLKVIDISSPTSPSLLSEFRIINPNDVHCEGNLVFMDGQNDGHGLSVIDVSRPQAPALVSYYEMPFDEMGFGVAGDTVLMLTAGGKMFARYSSCCEGVAGNINGLGTTDLSDLSYLVSYLTGGGTELSCATEANVDGRGIVDLGDLSAMVNYLTGGGFVLPNCP